jgi:hypothetical protein
MMRRDPAERQRLKALVHGASSQTMPTTQPAPIQRATRRLTRNAA